MGSSGKAAPFVSLHNHTELGSPLDGMNDTHDLFVRAKEIDHAAVAVTDHGTMTAIFDAWEASKKTGVQLIPGMEAYFANDLSVRKSNHMVFLAKNEIGYKNLLRLSYESFKNQVNSYMGKKVPRVSWEHIEKWNEGVICLTACSNGLIAKTLITEEDEAKAICHMNRLNNIFKDNFYLEIQPHSLYHTNKNGSVIDQGALNSAMVRLSHDMGIPYVVTCDAHYRDAEHAKYHDFMLAVKDKAAVDDPDRFRYGVQDMYLKTHEEIVSHFGPAIAQKGMDNSMKILAECENPTYLEPKGPILPKFPVRDEPDYKAFSGWREKKAAHVEEDKAYLRYKCMEGFKNIFPMLPLEQKREYWDRVKKELVILEDKDFSSYMLIVADYTNWAKEHMPVGPARGCLVGKTHVIMKNEVKRLDHIEVGDELFSHSGKIRKVTDTMKYEVDENLLEIETYYGDSDPLVLTKDHKVFAQKALRPDNYNNWADSTKKARASWKKPTSDIEEISAEDLRVGDWIFYPNLDFKGENNLTWNIKKNTELISVNSEFDYSIRDLSKKAGLSRSFLTKVANRLPLNLKNQKTKDCLIKLSDSIRGSFENIESWISYWKINSFRKYHINKEIKLDQDLAWLFGKWIADGWMSKSGKWGVCFHSDEIEQMKRVKFVLEGLGVNYIKTYEHKTKKLVQFETSNKPLLIWWKSIFSEYEFSSKTKYIPKDLMSVSRPLLRYLIAGIIDGDGHIMESRVNVTTVSRKLAEQLKYCYLRFSLPSSISINKRIHTHLGHTEESISYAVEAPKDSNKNRYVWHKTDKGFFVKINKISERKDVDFVYDITVDEDHSYLTTNGAVHNSAAGSLVAFLIGCTTINPMDYGLIFERFHNAQKTSFPDIDTDFAEPGKVKEYLKAKYGEDKVASISNLSTMSPKVALKDAARSLRLGGDKSSAFKIANHLTSIMPDANSIEEAIAASMATDQQDFAREMRRYPELYEYATKLQGLTRNWGMHAAGVVISDVPLYELVPLRIDQVDPKNPDTWITATQWEKKRCEKFGLVKMDCLGLKTLVVIDDAVKIIQDRTGEVLDMEQVALDDSSTYDMIGRGETAGVFQLESSMTPYCIKIKPRDIEGISAINALGRPSCTKEVRKEYIDRVLGHEPVKFDHPKLERSLGGTAGILLYEESAMYVAADVAGWDFNQADGLRKLSKYKGSDPELALKLEASFVNDSVEHGGLKYKEGMHIWKKFIEPMSGYSFNKSHSISYSKISYWTAWLRCHFPTEFMCALMNSENPNSDKTQEYLNECRKMKIEITPPNVAKSGGNYVVTDDSKIATGLSAVKGVGDSAIIEIISAAPESLVEFFAKTAGRKVNKRVMEALAKAGAFDCFGITRKDIYENYAKYRTKVNAAIKKVKDRKIRNLMERENTLEIFKALKAKEKKEMKAGYEEMICISDEELDSILEPISFDQTFEEWDRKTLLMNEMEVLGRTISGQLHEVFGSFFRRGSSIVTPLSKVPSLEVKEKVKIEVIVKALIKEFKIKNGKNVGRRFAKYLVEDIHGDTIGMTVWADDYERYRTILKDGVPLKAICRVNEFMGKKDLALAVLENVAGKRV